MRQSRPWLRWAIQAELWRSVRTAKFSPGLVRLAVGSDLQKAIEREGSVIFITTYRIKQQSKDETKKLMGVFAEKGVPSTVKAHYVAADGSQGVVIADANDLEEAYRNLLNYTEWIEYETKPYLTIEQALPHIADYVG